jgi:AcrR family transcriptional regulator
MAKSTLTVPTETRLLDAAFSLFLDQGYHGTSMRQVASRAGITPGSIYNHFISKEALFVALLRERIPHRALVDALAGVEGDTTEALVQDALARMLDAMSDQFDNLRLMFVELIEFQGRHAGEIGRTLLPQLVTFIERLRAAEERLRPVPSILLARIFFGQFFAYVMTATLLRDIPGFEANAAGLQTMGDVFLFGALQTVE